jgi:hypothetical protein
MVVRSRWIAMTISRLRRMFDGIGRAPRGARPSSGIEQERYISREDTREQVDASRRAGATAPGPGPAPKSSRR